MEHGSQKGLQCSDLCKVFYADKENLSWKVSHFKRDSTFRCVSNVTFSFYDFLD